MIDIKDMRSQIAITTTAENAMLFTKLASDHKISKKDLFEEMLEHCIKNNVIKGIKRKKNRSSCYIDHRKNILSAWENGSRSVNGDGKKIITVSEIKNYMVNSGRSEATAQQYLTKKIPQNPIFIGINEGWLVKENEVFIIKIKQLGTFADLKAAITENELFALAEKIGLENLPGMTPDEKDAAYVKAYYE